MSAATGKTRVASGENASESSAAFSASHACGFVGKTMCL